MKGFTLIELLIVLSITAVLAAIALPYYGHNFREKHLRVAAETFYADMQLARSEAIKRGTYVVMNLSDSDGSMPPSYAIGTTNNDSEITYSNVKNVVIKEASDITMSIPDQFVTIYINPINGRFSSNSTGTFLSDATVDNQITFNNSDGDSIGVQFNYIGTIRLCLASGNLKEYPPC